MTKTTKRVRRSPEQMIDDLQREIERVKVRAAQARAKKDPALKYISAAVRSIDKAAKATGDAATRKAMEEARSTLAACLLLAGAAPPRVGSSRKGLRIEPQAVLDYLDKHGASSGEDIAAALGTDARSLRPVVKKLVESNQVKANGKARGTRYLAVR